MVPRASLKSGFSEPPHFLLGSRAFQSQPLRTLALAAVLVVCRYYRENEASNISGLQALSRGDPAVQFSFIGGVFLVTHSCYGCRMLESVALHELFSVPVLTKQCEPDPALTDFVEGYFKNSPDKWHGPDGRGTTRGGWQSEAELQDSTDRAIQRLIARAKAMGDEMIARRYPDLEDFRGWTVRAWANINPPGLYIGAHDHTFKQGAQERLIWSGVCYVDIGTPGSGGKTTFQDRSQVPVAGENLFCREEAIEPREGMMILFPGTQYHYVSKYTGEENRATIAFNLHSDQFDTPLYPGMGPPVNWRWKYFLGPMLALQKTERAVKGLFGR